MKIFFAFRLLCRSCLLILTLCLPAQLTYAAVHKHNAKPVARHKAAAKQPRLASATAASEDDAEFTNFGQWHSVAEFIDQMHEWHGFDTTALHAQFARAHYLENVVKLINPPPASKVKNWTAYRQRFIEPTRIKAGAAFWNKYEQELMRAESQYGVPAEIIVGIIGVETLYGRMAGKIRVMDALTTLAFAYPETANREARMHYFRDELAQTLLYARDNDIDPFSLSGSFAGAIGWAQFMPGSVRRYAVDFDRDGKIDLRNSPVDAIGSVANFLVEHGWKSNLPLVFPVKIAGGEERRWQSLLGQSLDAKYSLDQCTQAGVETESPLRNDLSYGLVDLQDGERPTLYWLGTDNFFAISKYNRSFFYAMSVIELGEAVKQRRLQ